MSSPETHPNMPKEESSIGERREKKFMTQHRHAVRRGKVSIAIFGVLA
jgi:hypothetical protein